MILNIKSKFQMMISKVIIKNMGREIVYWVLFIELIKFGNLICIIIRII